MIDRALTTGLRTDRIAAVKASSDIDDSDTDRLRLVDEWADWCWHSRYCGGEFDFADEADFRRGIDLFLESARKRYTRSRPNTPSIARQQFGWRSMLYRLKAKIDIRPIAEQEVKATGWDRSDYRP